ncbi:MAG: glycosyltransferase [Clostridia bacterium]|nr:glycosyltransferase [Clostridia bacterium]
MKILQVSDSFYPNVDGPNAVMLNLSLALQKLGHEVELLVPDYPKNRVEAEGLKIYRCPSIPAGKGYRCALPFLGRGLKKLIKNGKFDLIHLHSCFPLAKFAQKLGRKYKIPVMITVHTKFRDEFENRLKLKCLQRFMMHYIMKCIERCDGIVSVSRGMVGTLEEYGSKRCKDIKVIYNAAATPPAAEGGAVAALRKKLGTEDKFSFMFAGRLAEVKNVQFSLAVLGEVKKRGYKDFKFIIVGDGDYGKTLKKLTAEYKLTENVVFAGRISDPQTLANYYSASDLMLFPSTFDTFGLVVSEAASNCLPAAAIKGSCSAERIEHGVSGFAWEYDKCVWVEEIIKLLENPAPVKTAGEGAKNYVCLSWDTVSKEYLDFYNELKNG